MTITYTATIDGMAHDRPILIDADPWTDPEQTDDSAWRALLADLEYTIAGERVATVRLLQQDRIVADQTLTLFGRAETTA